VNIFDLLIAGEMFLYTVVFVFVLLMFLYATGLLRI